MFEIKGIMTTAVCYATVVEDESIEQIRRMCDQEFTRGSRVRIMPDVHAGKGCTIGTTMTVTDKVVPNVVGVDIGCGMYTINIGKDPIDLARLDEAAHYVPSGMSVWEGRKERFDLQDLRCYRALRDTKRLERSLGTLGGGNHFIEVDRSSDGTQYLVIHTGSRNLGKQVAEYYQNLAIDLHKGKEEYFAKKDVLIAEYKAAGRRSEIEKALKALHWNNRELQIPEDLCYLYGSYFEDYLHDVEICQQFALRNRELIAEILMDRAGLQGMDGFHTIHNYIDVEERILRKGAISAQKGERVLIPINMRHGSILACGKGNPDWNYSAPHGAGRAMSRSKARVTLDLEVYRQSMEGVYTTSVNPGTLDEAPMAYKSLADIAGVIGDTVEIIDILKPIYNFKASEEAVGKRLR
ncbi:MAG: RtcB family protein [Lachnospiraceae bacterium]|nr:RtcB family protein [Lachnospiraceae bacterium]